MSQQAGSKEQDQAGDGKTANAGGAGQEDIGAKQLQLLQGIHDKLEAGATESTGLTDEDRELFQTFMGSRGNEEKNETPDEDFDLETVSGVQKALKAMERKFETELAAREQELTGAIETTRSNQVQAEIDKEFKEARDTFGAEEFKKHEKETLAVLKKHPGLTVSDAYLLATAREDKDQLTAARDKKRQEDLKKAAASAGVGIDVGSLSKDVKANTHRDAASDIYDKLEAAGGKF